MTSSSPATPLLFGPQALERCELRSLTRCRTAEHVATSFGSARSLTEQLLGRPRHGGHATADVVRNVGRLVNHPLGPAMAAEALSLVVVLGDLIDTGTVRDVLALAWSSDVISKPFERDSAARLERVVRSWKPTARRARLLKLWRASRREFFGTTSCEWLPAARAAVIVTATENDQVDLAKGASTKTLGFLASWDLVWSLDGAVVRVLVERCPEVLAANRYCPALLARALTKLGVQPGKRFDGIERDLSVPVELRRYLGWRDEQHEGRHRWWDPDFRAPESFHDWYDAPRSVEALTYGIEAALRPPSLIERTFPRIDSVFAPDALGNGWRLRLITSRDELQHNARLMGNCTEHYWDSIADAEYLLFRVSDPAGEPYNVGFRHYVDEDESCWYAEQALGRFNSGLPPSDVVDRLREIVVAADDPEADEPADQFKDPVRLPTFERPDRHDPFEERPVRHTGPYSPGPSRQARMRAKARQARTTPVHAAG